MRHYYLLALALLISCDNLSSSDPWLDDGTADNAIAEDSPEALAVLKVANEASAEDLAEAAGIAADIAQAIVDYRLGPDALPETDDDERYDTLVELAGVLPEEHGTVLEALLDYARSLGYIEEPPAAECVEPQPSPGTGKHNPGKKCLTCHKGGGAPKWTLAGTVYTDIDGSDPSVGTTISVVDANGLTLSLVTADNGNFWTDQELEFPVSVTMATCPSPLPMDSAVNSGNCNACHGSSGRRIH